MLENGITEIGEYVFYTGVNACQVSCPESLRSIGRGAFRNAHPTQVTLNEGLLSIGEYAFDDPSNCLSVVIPRSVKNIGYRAFTDAILWAYPGTEGQHWCQVWGVKYQTMTDAVSERRQSLMTLLDAISGADDVPARYRQPAMQTLLGMNSLTAEQLNKLANYVRDEKPRLKTAMSDDDLSFGEITGFINRFVDRMNAIGVTVSTNVKLINGRLGVELEVTVGGKKQTLSDPRQPARQPGAHPNRRVQRL